MATSTTHTVRKTTSFYNLLDVILIFIALLHFFHFFLVVIKFEVANEQVRFHLEELASFLQNRLSMDDAVGNIVLFKCFQYYSQKA